MSWLGRRLEGIPTWMFLAFVVLCCLLPVAAHYDREAQDGKLRWKTELPPACRVCHCGKRSCAASCGEAEMCAVRCESACGRERADAGGQDGPAAVYSRMNVQWFEGVADWGETGGENIATTAMLPDGRFHLGFNRRYAEAPRVLELYMLHEQCHVRAWGRGHGPAWKSCMLQLDIKGAFRKALIDDFEGQ